LILVPGALREPGNGDNVGAGFGLECRLVREGRFRRFQPEPGAARRRADQAAGYQGEAVTLPSGRVSTRWWKPASPLTRLVVSVGASGLADGMAKVAAPVYVAYRTGNARLVAGTAVAVALPWLVFGLTSGVIADRVPRRLALQLGNAARAAALAGITAGIATTGLPVFVLYALLLVLGAGETLAESAAQALVPDIVSGPGLDSANGRVYGTMAICQQVGGQALGGILFAVATPVPFATSALMFAAAICVAATISTPGRRPPDPAQPPSTIRADIADGLRWLWRHRLLRTLAIVGGTANFLFAGVFAVLVLLVRQRLGVGSTGYGLILAVGAAGALLGSLLTDRLVRFLGRRPILAGWVLVQAVIWALMAVAASPLAVAVLLAAGWFTAMTASVATTSLRQELVPGRMLGRVTSVFRMLSWGTMPFGALAAGFLAATAGLSAPYWVTAALLTVVGGVAAFVVMHAEVPDGPAGSRPVPDTPVQKGPVPDER
jgi:MFS family permease